MARPRYPRTEQPLPPPLPPEQRTVGQLVAETFHAYGRNVWIALLLGCPFAVMQQVYRQFAETDVDVQRVGGADWRLTVGLLVAFAPLFSASYVVATHRVVGAPLELRSSLAAIVAGTIAFIPAAVLFAVFILAATAWLALVGLVVPVVLVEHRRIGDAFRRAVGLARVDYVHALASLATLILLFVFVRIGLAALLRSQAETTQRLAECLTDLVLSPVLFLGAAVLYVDQEARFRHRKPS